MKIFLMITSLLAAFFVYGEDVNRPVARVNDQVITSKDLDDYCATARMQYEQMPSEAELNPDEPGFRKRALNKLIEDKLLIAAARAEKNRRDKDAEKDEKKSDYRISVPPAWVDAQVDRAAQGYPSRDDFEKALAKNGLNNYTFREKLKDRYLTQYIVEAEIYRFISVSPEEVMDYYNKHKSSFYAPVRFKLLTARFADVKEWDRFNALYRQQGIDAVNKEFPGALREVDTEPSRLRREFADPLRSASTGSAFDAGIDGEIYFFYVKEKTEPRPLTFEEARDAITNLIWNMKFKLKYTDFIKELKKKFYVQLYPPFDDAQKSNPDHR